jgi:Domain of unknown function (DUF4232)/Ricin-type beta-trefoil lectin domain
MMISRSAAGLAAAACLVMLTASCGANSGAPETGTGHTPAAAPAQPSTPAGTPASPPATTAPVTTAPGSQAPVPRCHTSQLTAAYTGLNAAMGGSRGMTLILTNHSGSTCYVHGYPGLAFFDGNGFPMTTHLTWMKEPHATVILHPGGNAQAMLTWRVNMDTATPFNPSIAHITPPDEYTYLWNIWQGGPVLGGNITAWPLRAAPAGPFPAGTGTIANPFNGMCMALAGDGTTVVAWKCSPGATSQQWTGYNDGTLRIGGKCLDVTGPKVGARVKAAACTGAATQKWAIGQVSYNDFGPITNTATGNALTDPAGSTVNGTRLVMGPGRGDLSGPWRVSYHHYMTS